MVACARLLGIDLWRIETDRIRLEDVGLVAADTTANMTTNPSLEALMNLKSETGN